MNPELNHNRESHSEFKFDEEKPEVKPETKSEVKSKDKSEASSEIQPNTSEIEQTIESKANYQGYWDDALHDRLSNDEIKAQFVISRMHYAKDMPDKADIDPYKVKEKETSDHYISQVANYDDNLANAFSYAEHVPAADKDKKPKALGASGYGKFATVFQDAAKDGKELTTRQKNIIFAHELGHSIRDYQGGDKEEIRKAADFSQVENSKTRRYLEKPDEIIERMSQLKNYFGMKGAEKFTKEHLNYAREHYVKDTELDNDITKFFKAITPETEDAFIDVINKFGV